jgi:hypothetical protein
MLASIIDKIGPQRFPAPLRLDDAAWVAYRLAETLPLEVEARQRMLEMSDPIGALEALRAFLQSKAITA